MKYSSFLLFAISLFLMVTPLKAQHVVPPYLENITPAAQAWVDSMMNQLSPEEKVAQLFMISAYSNKDEAHFAEIENFIKKYKLGGLIFMQGTPDKQAELINRYQKSANIPLLIGFDGEWGLSMRLKNVVEYPRQMLLGALQNDLLVYEMGREFARQMKLVGIHFNFAPVIDINNNPKNPVINDRAFGEDINNVIRKGIMYSKGLQDGGVLSSAKHFPGHGDTDVDSHYDLPVIKHSRARLDSVEFQPFRALSAAGVGSMMVSHLSMPAIDNTPNLPTTLSTKVVDGILRKEIGYQGIIFTDAMNMKGITKFFPSGEAEVRALLAGNDIMLFSENVPKAMDGVLAAIKSGRLTQELIDEKVKKVLLAKYWLGLNQPVQLSTQNLDAQINTEYAKYLKEKLMFEAITVVSDDKNLFPLGDLSKIKVAAVHIDGNNNNTLTEILNKYGEVKHFYISKDASVKEFHDLRNELKSFDIVINAHFGLVRAASKKHGITDQVIQFTKQISEHQQVINVFFGLPYVLNYFGHLPTAIIAYVDDAYTQSATAQLIYGGIGSTAKLPVRAGSYPVNTGVQKVGGVRLKYVHPMYMGVLPEKLKGIDKIVNDAIKSGATPGAQILVSYKGAVIYEKSFGKPTTTSFQSVKNTDIYDIASITKITASAPVLMHMNQNGWLDINKKLGDYLPELKGNKSSLVIKDILAHQSGLPAWIPFYKKTLDENKLPKTDAYAKDSSETFSIKVADKMYMNKAYIDTLYKDIDEAPLQSATYRYSDLGYYYFKKIAEKKFQQPYEVIVDSLIWKKLGGIRTMYNPLSKGIDIKEIIPTEDDQAFRMQKIQGYVHDQGAAMLGGVAGHAGLFSNANDLAKYFQMLLNRGTYGQVKFFNPELVDKFTSRVSQGNRRALAFDKSVVGGGDGPSCDCVSDASFGHTGFTGTIAWADPKNEVIFIFLSNRTYPNAENRLLINQNIRPKIQQVIYDAIGK